MFAPVEGGNPMRKRGQKPIFIRQTQERLPTPLFAPAINRASLPPLPIEDGDSAG